MDGRSLKSVMYIGRDVCTGTRKLQLVSLSPLNHNNQL